LCLAVPSRKADASNQTGEAMLILHPVLPTECWAEVRRRSEQETEIPELTHIEYEFYSDTLCVYTHEDMARAAVTGAIPGSGWGSVSPAPDLELVQVANAALRRSVLTFTPHP